jgi:hypothetical protein
MALGALVASSASTKTAEAHSNAVKRLTNIHTPTPTTIVSSAPASSTTVAQTVVLVAAAVEVVTPPPADPYLENPKLRRMRTNEITPSMRETAAKIVREHYAKPVGTLIEVDVDGKHVIARIERHFHAEGGPVKPWGFHPGVSLFALR